MNGKISAYPKIIHSKNSYLDMIEHFFSSRWVSTNDVESLTLMIRGLSTVRKMVRPGIIRTSSGTHNDRVGGRANGSPSYSVQNSSIVQKFVLETFNMYANWYDPTTNF